MADLLKISVSRSGWSLAQPEDIEVLLMNTASHLNELLRNPVTDSVEVVQAPEHDSTPRTHYRTAPTGPVCVQLTARDQYWAQYAYQFAHEFCHIISNYERLSEGPNGWFHEAICELSSIFTLRRMAQSWQTDPPYSNWANFAGALYVYAEEYLARQERQLPQGMTLAVWLSSEEENLRNDRYMRDKNAVVAYSLLPIFEMYPTGWNAVRCLPDSGSMLVDYLLEWAASVEPVDRPFVERIVRALGA